VNQRLTRFDGFPFQLATRSIEPSFGLLFGDLLQDLDVGTTGAAIIISTLDIMMNLSGLFVGPLLKEFSYRKVAIVGSLLCSLGLALTAGAESMAHILTTYSVINGEFEESFRSTLSIKLVMPRTFQLHHKCESEKLQLACAVVRHVNKFSLAIIAVALVQGPHN
jgi:MFS family permease